MPENIPVPRINEGITLREYLEAQIEGVRRELLLVQEAQAIAVSKAEEAQQLRNEAMNEWRQTVGDILGRAATKEQLSALELSLRNVVEALEKAMEQRIGVSADRIVAIEKRGSGQTGWIAGAAAVGALILSLLLWWFQGGRGG
jgi:hypothetical protein